MTHLRAILALGRIAHQALIKTYGMRQADFAFGHGAEHRLADDLILLDSYHCSRYNVQTNRLTTEMFDTIIARLRELTN